MLNQLLYVGQFHATRSCLAPDANSVSIEGPSWLTGSEGRNNTTNKS